MGNQELESVQDHDEQEKEHEDDDSFEVTVSFLAHSHGMSKNHKKKNHKSTK